MNAIDILHYGHLTVLSAVKGLPDADWETGGVCGVWSVKDILAHLASYEDWLGDVLDGLLDASAPKPHLEMMWGAGDGYNDLMVAARRDQSVETVMSAYTAAFERVMARARQIPASTLQTVGTIPWYGEGYAVDDLIVYAFYGHKREHCAQIDAFRSEKG